MSRELSINDPLEQGRTLLEKAVDVHVVNGFDMLARWYYSPHDADLMIWFDAQNHVTRFQLNSCGQIVDWNDQDGVQTGLIVEFEVRKEVAETIQFDSQINVSAVAAARMVLENAAALNPAVCRQMLADLDDIRPASCRPRAIEARSRFWNRFKHWTTGA